ncbi:uncharacterized protein LOC118264781 isoform X1 [Spodoptera frugiperda]|uniref:Uncharacterized protein LOC118264781 isoform X1 n=1 Tax=Spodoptera frugiperda TaxID=7108 RepID=A0A9R0CY79_SPOFR|nr:uncharacterized protein LOC118264781 isoform X1 [Spodoptera frugiperda]
MIKDQNLFKMPTQLDFIKKSLKNVCVDTVLLFVMLAVVGHFTINFWERFTLQSELTNMKHSLHSLKDTITNIGKAYDGLHTELKDLVKIVDHKPHYVPEHKHKREVKDRCKTEPSLEYRKLNDIQVQTALTDTSKVGTQVLMTTDKQTGHDGHAHKSTGPVIRNTGTNTKNPSNTVGVMSDLSKVELDRRSLSDRPLNDLIHLHSLNHLGCYKNYEQCRKVCHRATSQT